MSVRAATKRAAVTEAAYTLWQTAGFQPDGWAFALQTTDTATIVILSFDAGTTDHVTLSYAYPSVSVDLSMRTVYYKITAGSGTMTSNAAARS